MEDETRKQRLLREANEEYEREKTAIKGMSPDEKRVLRILIFAAVLLSFLGTLAITYARADVSIADIPLRFKCPLSSKTCEVDRVDFEQLLLSNRTAVAELERLQNAAKTSRCRSDI